MGFKATCPRIGVKEKASQKRTWDFSFLKTSSISNLADNLLNTIPIRVKFTGIRTSHKVKNLLKAFAF